MTDLLLSGQSWPKRPSARQPDPVGQSCRFMKYRSFGLPAHQRLTMIRADPQRRTDHYSIHWLRHILVRHEVPAFLIQLELSSARRDRFTIGSSIVTGVAWERV